MQSPIFLSFFIFVMCITATTPDKSGVLGAGGAAVRTCWCCDGAVLRGTFRTGRKKTKPLTPLISSPRTPTLPGDPTSGFDWARGGKPRHRETRTGRKSTISAPHSHHVPVALGRMELMMMETLRDREAFGAAWPNKLGLDGRRAAEELPVPRSSSPVSIYVELPSIADQAFATIEWEDLEGCASTGRQERGSLCFQADGSDPYEQHYGDYALDFIADSTGESCLSELGPFQGCVIPPLTPQRDFSPEDSMVHSSKDQALDEVSWREIVEGHGRELEDSMAINKQLQETLHRQQRELDSHQDRNLHLKQLASQAKNLASVLERLMTVRDSDAGVLPLDKETSLSPCKRQRLDEGYETESSDSVEDLLRDISTRCNAVLLSNAAGAPHESETIRLYGAFSSLQMSTPNNSTVNVDASEAAESASSFRTSVREHGTIRTQVFPHGRAFTSRTLQGGYRFRWVPNHS